MAGERCVHLGLRITWRLRLGTQLVELYSLPDAIDVAVRLAPGCTFHYEEEPGRFLSVRGHVVRDQSGDMIGAIYEQQTPITPEPTDDDDGPECELTLAHNNRKCDKE